MTQRKWNKLKDLIRKIFSIFTKLIFHPNTILWNTAGLYFMGHFYQNKTIEDIRAIHY